MAYTDKKNEWWRIDDANADINMKAAEIFRILASKYPTIVINGRRAHFTIKEITIHLIIRQCIGVKNRVLLRYSTNEDDMTSKSTKSCRGLHGEVREGHEYSDGSSRIDLDYAFNQVNSLIEKKSKSLDEIKKTKFRNQIEQMKMVGRIKLCINDDKFSVEPCQLHTNKVMIFNKHKEKILTLTKYDDYEFFIVNIQNIGNITIKFEDIENFIKASEGFFEYVKGQKN